MFDENTSPDAFISQLANAGNLVGVLDETKAGLIAQEVLEDYRTDKTSMKDWLDKMKAGIELAKLIKGKKTYPYKNAANIKFPLITSAALQFNARAYPAIVPADQPVKAQTFGADPAGQKAARGQRVSNHMSFQLLSKIEEWEEDTDRLLVQLPIVGTMIRKTWYDAERKRTRSRLIKPGCFIVNDNVSALDEAPRMTEEIPLYPNEIRGRIKSGTFVPFDWGEESDRHKPEDFIEQHCLYDLDDDGYMEPYIATVHVKTQKLVRMVADFEESDVTYRTERRMEPLQAVGADGAPVVTMQPVEVPQAVTHIDKTHYFTAYHFLPSLDGGFWGTGLGLLLGDISSAINSTINMLMDAGHYASLGGGFLGSEFRIKGGHQRMAPGEWRMVQSRGLDLRQAIVDLKYPGPDATLFQMLGLLIEAGREVASVKDILTGDSGSKNMTATTTLALIEQGLMVFTAAYKRIYRSLKAEFRIMARINRSTVSPEEYNAFHDDVDANGQPMRFDPAMEYDLSDMDMLPVADPRSVTKMQEAAKAQVVMELGMQGMVDPAIAGQRVLESANVPETEELMPKPDPLAEPMAMMALESAKADLMDKMAGIQLTMAKVQQARSAAAKNYAEAKAEEDRVQIDAFDELLKMLEMQKDELTEAIGRGSGAVEGTPRNQSSQAAVPLAPGGAQVPNIGALLGGQADQ